MTLQNVPRLDYQPGLLTLTGGATISPTDPTVGNAAALILPDPKSAVDGLWARNIMIDPTILYIVGTSANENFVINATTPASTSVTINGTAVLYSPFNLSASQAVWVTGNGGTDNFTISGSAGSHQSVRAGRQRRDRRDPDLHSQRLHRSRYTDRQGP